MNSKKIRLRKSLVDLITIKFKWKYIYPRNFFIAFSAKTAKYVLEEHIEFGMNGQDNLNHPDNPQCINGHVELVVVQDDFWVILIPGFIAHQIVSYSQGRNVNHESYEVGPENEPEIRTISNDCGQKQSLRPTSIPPISLT